MYLATNVTDKKYQDKSLNFSILWSGKLHKELLKIEDNLIHTGVFKINLNDEAPIIREYEFFISWHGFCIQKEFFIKNEGTSYSYCEIYLDNIEGDLGKFIEITIKDGDIIYWKGLLSDFTENNACVIDDALRVGEKKHLTIMFTFIGYLK